MNVDPQFLTYPRTVEFEIEFIERGDLFGNEREHFQHALRRIDTDLLPVVTVAHAVFHFQFRMRVAHGAVISIGDAAANRFAAVDLDVIFIVIEP